MGDMADDEEILPLQRLHILLLKTGLRDFENALRHPGRVNSFALKAAATFDGRLFMQRPTSEPPPWLKFVDEGVQGGLGALTNRTNSAVLFLAASRRTFALTFGHGRHLLDAAKIVDDFGLKVALNGLNPESLRSLDSVSVEEQTVHMRRQSSRASRIDAFGLDIGRDMLRAITGVPKEDSGVHGLAGSEGTLAVSARVKFNDLASLCSRLLTLYRKTDYQRDFAWVDNVARVKDPTKLSQLDNTLVVGLRRTDRSGIYLAVPEPIEWMDVQRFAYSRDRDADDLQPNLETYLAEVDIAGLTIDQLKRDRLFMFRAANPDVPHAWTIYKSLIAEIQRPGERFILSAGEWFKVAESFAEEIREIVDRIPVSTIAFPKLADDGAGNIEDEPAYNQRLAREDPSLALLDGKTAKCRGAVYGVEPCDLLSATGQFIHIKRRTGGSSKLSHLFSQARVSAEALLSDENYRDEVRALLLGLNPAWEARVSKARPDPATHEIVFAILEAADTKPGPQLPFFSQVTLARTAQYLISTGFPVSQIGIGV
jgi:uncharacterized protein (TIGR04141 family)